MTGGGIDRRGPKDSENAHNSFFTKSTEKGFWRFAVDMFGKRLSSLCYGEIMNINSSKKTVSNSVGELTCWNRRFRHFLCLLDFKVPLVTTPSSSPGLFFCQGCQSGFILTNAHFRAIRSSHQWPPKGHSFTNVFRSLGHFLATHVIFVRCQAGV